MEQESFKDVHTEHCCILHGCKYGKDDKCTVMLRKAKQGYPCEYCDEKGITTLEEVFAVDEGRIKVCPHCRHVL